MRIATLIIAAIAICTAAGCATFSTSDPTARLVPQYLAAKFIEQGQTEEARLEKARRVKQIAQEAQTWLDFNGVTVEFLEHKAMERLADLHLGTADMLLARELVRQCVAYLQSRVGTGQLDPGARVTVNQLFEWIAEAAELYGA